MAIASIRRGAIPSQRLPTILSSLLPSSRFMSLASARAPSYYNLHNSLSTLTTSTFPKRALPNHLTSPPSTIITRPYSSSSSNNTEDAMSSEPAEPTGPIATDGLELFTLGTPNGYKASIALEELREAYGDKLPAVTYQTINIMKNTQKEPWFTAICPNGRIPALLDHDRAGGFAVFEGLAILSYLAKHYDPDHVISFPYDSDDYSVAEQWMAWQHGGLGPM